MTSVSARCAGSEVSDCSGKKKAQDSMDSGQQVALVGAAVAVVVVTRLVARRLLQTEQDAYTEVEALIGRFLDREYETVYHKDVLILKVGQSAWTSRTSKIGYMNSIEKIKMYEEGYHSHYFDRILECSIIGSTLAYARVKYAIADDVITSSLIIIKEKSWQIIHDVQTRVTIKEGEEVPKLLDEPSAKIDDLLTATECVQKYIRASLESDGKLMASLLARLMRCVFVANDASMKVLSAEQFLNAIVQRWTALRHIPYSHLKNDHRLVQSASILHISFQSPRVAVAKVRICIPPLAYTELLFLVKNTRDNIQYWTIVAQSFAVLSSFLERDIRPDMYLGPPSPEIQSDSNLVQTDDDIGTYNNNNQEQFAVIASSSHLDEHQPATAFDFIQTVFQDNSENTFFDHDDNNTPMKTIETSFTSLDGEDAA